MRSRVFTLHLAYPPISNQELEWVGRVKEVREALSGSKLYMIGQRREVLFERMTIDLSRFEITTDLVSGDTRIEAVRIPLGECPEDVELILEAGPKLVRITKADGDGTDDSVVLWFTVDSLLYDYWRGATPEVEGLDGFRAFTQFDLLYVGISKNNDSLTRLLGGHHARVKVLSNQTQVRPEARLTDEVMVFLFEVDSHGVNTLEGDSEEEIARFLDDSPPDLRRIVADAEKAFVHVLEPEYNDQLYASYPVSRDGLHDEGLHRRAFTISEPLSFTGNRNSIQFESFDAMTAAGDAIVVSQNSVEILRQDGSMDEV